MKKQRLGALVLLLLPSVALARFGQESRGHGYVYFAPGVTAPESRQYSTLLTSSMT